MKLGELKKSLARMSPDLDDIEVLLNYVDGDNGKSEYDCLAFTAYADLPKVGLVCILGSMKEACERIKNKSLHNPDGSCLSDEGIDINSPEDEEDASANE